MTSSHVNDVPEQSRRMQCELEAVIGERRYVSAVTSPKARPDPKPLPRRGLTDDRVNKAGYDVGPGALRKRSRRESGEQTVLRTRRPGFGPHGVTPSSDCDRKNINEDSPTNLDEIAFGKIWKR
ncbi:hypothetical protein EVAR_65474_1 [Eumeta japonica]|uniref:Uncharacterized protein n=1 Tax=Eumeta variegata TaxID=151549 RepID=A0A4C2A0G8_EUMVA|nr:hypothetical protein EVAR_65474_1 [Eumeta japonica]